MALDATRIPVGHITGQFALVSADTEDAGKFPQFTGVLGTVTLTCSAVGPIRFTDQGKTIQIIPEPVSAQFNSDGEIVGVNGEPLTLLAGDDPRLNPSGFTWRISFNLTSAETGRPIPITAYDFTVNTWTAVGDEVDVASLMPVAASGGVLITSGPQGQSAYQVAVANGFVGTVTEWLASLVGPAGNAEGIVLDTDPRLTDARTPVAHNHVIGDVAGLQAALDSVSVEVTWSDVTGKPATYAPSAHQHAVGDTTGLQAALDAAGAAPAWSEVTGKPATFAPTIGATASTAAAGNDARLTNSRTPTAHSHPTSEVTGLDTALAGKAASVHTHTVADTTGLQAALDAKGTSNLTLGTTAATAKAGDYQPSWTQVTGKPTVFTPDTHAHAVADVTGLQAALDSKGTSNLALGTTASTAKAGNYVPAWTEVTSKPTTFAPTIGATASTAVAGNDARLSDARTPVAHSHAIADTTGLQTALDGKQVAGSYAAASHTHTIANVTGLQAALDGKGTSNLAIGTTGSTAKAGNYAPTVADIPAGSTLTVKFSSTWPARPTARTDVTVFWVGSATVPSGALAGDVHFKDMA